MKIYACTGIGDVQSKQEWNYWTDNTETVNNTQAVNTLLALINRNYIEVTRLLNITPAEKIANLNDIDVYVVCLDAARRFAEKPELLKRAGYVIAGMMEKGEFNCDSLDNTERDAHLDQLLAKAETGYADEATPEVKSDFVTWYQQTVIDRNRIVIPAKEREEIQAVLKKSAAKIQGIGELDWRNNAELSKYLMKGSEYFLYTYFTDAQLNRLPAKQRRPFIVKREKQRKTYNYCKSLFVDVYGSENEMREIIRAGIINYFTVTPENVCEDIVSGKRKVEDIGALGAAAIVTIVTAVLSAVLGIVKAICDAVARTNEAKYGALDKSIVDSSIPDPSDFEGLDDGGGLNIHPRTGESKTWLWIAALAAGALLLFKKK